MNRFAKYRMALPGSLLVAILLLSGGCVFQIDTLLFVRRYDRNSLDVNLDFTVWLLTKEEDASKKKKEDPSDLFREKSLDPEQNPMVLEDTTHTGNYDGKLQYMTRRLRLRIKRGENVDLSRLLEMKEPEKKREEGEEARQAPNPKDIFHFPAFRYEGERFVVSIPPLYPPAKKDEFTHSMALLMVGGASSMAMAFGGDLFVRDAKWVHLDGSGKPVAEDLPLTRMGQTAYLKIPVLFANMAFDRGSLIVADFEGKSVDPDQYRELLLSMSQSYDARVKSQKEEQEREEKASAEKEREERAKGERENRERAQEEGKAGAEGEQQTPADAGSGSGSEASPDGNPTAPAAPVVPEAPEAP